VTRPRIRNARVFDFLIALGSGGLVLWGISELVAGDVSGVFLLFAGASALGFAALRLWRTGHRSPPPTRAEREGALAGAFFLMTGLVITFGALVLLVREISLLNAAATGIGIFLVFVGAAVFLGSRHTTTTK
jgi:hypothetical protein